MRLARNAFTIIELMVSISILSIIIIFLFKSYTSLNISNNILKEEIDNIQRVQKLKKVLYLDFSLAIHNSIKIENREKNQDVIFFQSSNSIHKRHNPYITYIVKNQKLYRLESLKEITSYELVGNSEFDVDDLGMVKKFRIYRSSSTENELYLISINFKNLEDIVLKVKVLNEY